MQPLEGKKYLTAGSLLRGEAAQPEQEVPLPNRYRKTDALLGSFMRINPIAPLVRSASQELQYDDKEGYSPFDEPESIAGYPPDIFIRSHSPEETEHIKRDYDNQLFLRNAAQEEGFAGTVGALAGGITNPLYLMPYLRMARMATTPGTLALEGAFAEGVTEGIYQVGNLDYTRTMGESVFNIAVGGVFSGIMGKGLGAGRKAVPHDLDLDEVTEALAKEAKLVDEPRPKFEPNSFFARLADELGVKIDAQPEVIAGDNTTRILGQSNARLRPGEIRLSTDEALWETAFENKNWTKPRKQRDGSYAEALPENAFNSPEEFAEFIARHERAHLNHFKEAGETTGAYETRINNIAMEEMRASPRMTKEQIVPELKKVENVARIKGWLSRQAAKLTPIRVLASPNPEARKLGAMLGEQSVVGTTRESVETAVKKYDGFLGTGLYEARVQYRGYRSRVSGSDRINGEDFYAQISHALRNGDTHSIPEVQAAAQKIRREILDPIRVKAKEQGIYPSDENIQQFAESYFPRVYNFHKISANLSDFNKRIADYLEATQYGEGFARADLEQAAREISASIRHQYTGHNAMSSHQVFEASALKGRKVPVPDNVLEPYLMNDPEFVLRAWSHNMASQTEMTRLLGTTESGPLLEQVEKSWESMIEEASTTNPALALKLQRVKNDDLEVLQALHDRLLNRYKLPDNDSSTLVRMGRAGRNLTVLRHLGGMTLSAFPDMARPLYRHGLASYGKAVHNLAFNPQFRQMKRAEASRLGIALESVLNQRMTAVTELEYTPNFRQGGFMGAAEHQLSRMVVGSSGRRFDFGQITLMSPWNSSMKLIAYTMAEDGMMRMVNQHVKHAKTLAQGGIDATMAKRIKAQFAKYGDDMGGLKQSNLDKWDDLEAMEAVESALLKEVDATIITPGIMDKPLWMSSEVGKTIGQLKSFAFAATNKQFLPGTQNFNAMFVQGTLAAVTLGAMTWSLKRQLAGYDDQEMSPEELLLRGIEYSGAIGFGSELTNIGTGMANAMGLYKGEGNFRWAKQGLIGTIGGPNLGLLEDGMRAFRPFTKDEPNAGDVEALRRMMPYNNLFYARFLFDAAEQAQKNRLGIVE